MPDLQTTWGWLVAVYLFLGGLGAGAFIATAVVSFATRERFKATVHFGAWSSAISIAVGTLMLLIDVGKPFRALLLPKSFVNFGSWMAIGAWLLFGTMLLNGLFALFWTDTVLGWFGKVWKPLKEKRAIFQIVLGAIGIPVNLAVAIYTGVLLGVLPFRPLWNTWWLPALFTASALCTGGVLVASYAIFGERTEGSHRLVNGLGIYHVVMIAVEGAIWVYFLRTALGGSTDAALSAQLLTSGGLSLIFWIVVVGLGLGLPFLIHLAQLARLVKRTRPALMLHMVGIPLVLVGGLVMRWLVLSAGLPQMLASPSLQHILQGGVKFVP
jgi:formate-dependent nitrite reductase membrane component NrfD